MDEEEAYAWEFARVRKWVESRRVNGILNGWVGMGDGPATAQRILKAPMMKPSTTNCWPDWGWKNMVRPLWVGRWVGAVGGWDGEEETKWLDTNEKEKGRWIRQSTYTHTKRKAIHPPPHSPRIHTCVSPHGTQAGCE